MNSTNEVLATAPASESTESIRDYYSLKARGKWVLLRMIPKEERKTSGGIVISMAQAKTQHGIVVDVDSSEVKNLHVGDTVVFTNFVNPLDDVEELTGERDLYLVREEEVYARAEKITDPEIIAKKNAETRERFSAISRQYEEETRKADA